MTKTIIYGHKEWQTYSATNTGRSSILKISLRRLRAWGDLKNVL
jgi:hypothetical protein